MSRFIDSNEFKSTWALGFSDRYTVGVWMGNVDQRPMHEVTGSLGPALVLRAVFAELRRHQPDELKRFQFRISAGPGAQRVEWILDDEVISTTPTFLWSPTRGTHTAQARVWIADHQPIETDSVSFVVK